MTNIKVSEMASLLKAAESSVPLFYLGEDPKDIYVILQDLDNTYMIVNLTTGRVMLHKYNTIEEVTKSMDSNSFSFIYDLELTLGERS